MYLKNTKNGEVFAHSNFLAVLPNFVPCNLDGSLPDVVNDSADEDAVSDDQPKKTAKKRG